MALDKLEFVENFFMPCMIFLVIVVAIQIYMSVQKDIKAQENDNQNIWFIEWKINLISSLSTY